MNDSEAAPNPRLDRFRSELVDLINRYSLENNSDTPDFILADYLIDCLEVFNAYTNRRATWYKSKPNLDRLDGGSNGR